MGIVYRIKYNSFIALAFCLLIGQGVEGQEINNLREEREKYLEDIAYTENLLSKTESNRIDQLSKVRLLSGKIKSREKVISSMRREITYLDRSIGNRQSDIKVLEEDLDLLKRDYARMIQKAYMTKRSYDKVQYILAANDFNQAYKRIRYMQQYNKFRREQAEDIREKTDSLANHINKLREDQERQKNLLSSRQSEVARLNNEKREKDQVVSQLSKEEKKLRTQLQDKRRAMNEIEKEINRIMAAATGGNEEGEGMKLTPEMKIISNEFSQNRGRLPWPVERGVIISKYGKHKHEVLKQVDVENKGVDIATNPGANVRSIFDGRVSDVISIRGANLTVIIQHGEYFTVYHNLVDIKVKKGDVIQAKQVVGKSYWDKKSSSSEVHFELWKGNGTQNPESWLAK